MLPQPTEYLRARDSGLLAPHMLAEKFSGHGMARKWTAYRHLCHISRVIAPQMVEGNARIIVNLGPGWGKSEFCSLWTPVWRLETNPTRRLILATHTSPLARSFGAKVRDEFKSNPFLLTELKDDTTAKNEWHTDKGGGMRCVGMDESVIGNRGDDLFIDDPYGKWADAMSAAYRAKVEGWFHATAASRLEPNANIVVIHHRMHVNDLTGHLLKQPDGHQWTVISLPSIATAPDELGRQVGEPLDERRFDRHQLERKRLEASWSWEPMHQQNPQALGNGAIYNHFHEGNVEAVEIRRGEPVHLAIDFNINPGMHMLVCQHRPLDNLFTICHEIHGPRMNLKLAIAEFIRMWNGWPWRPEVWLAGDPAGNAADIKDGESNWQAVRILLSQAGIRVRTCVAAKAPGILESVSLVNQALKSTIDGRVSVKINPRCVRLVRDLCEVVGDEEGKPEKSNSDLTHSSDCMRYLIHYHSPGYTMKPRVQTGMARVMV